MQEAKEEAKRIGRLIRRYRVEKQLSQVGLARMCGMRQTAISSIENGVYKPRADIAEKLAHALDVPLEFLTEGQRLRPPREPASSPFASMMKEARSAKGWSQERLAEKVGISDKSISAFEAGQRQPMRLIVVERLAEALEIPMEELRRVWHPSHSPESRLVDGDLIECIRCHQVKPLSAFHEHQSRCKACREQVRQVNLIKRQGWTHQAVGGLLAGQPARISKPPRKAYKPHPEDSRSPVWTIFQQLPAQWFPAERLTPIC